MRVVIANEPRAYRDVLQQSLATLRPHLNVTVIEPAELDSAIAQVSPHLVFSSRLASSTLTGPITWVVLYPEGERLVVLDVAGQQTVTADVAFERLVAIVDETEQLLAQRRAGDLPQMS